MDAIKQSVQKKIDDLERERKSYQNLIQVTRTNRDNPKFYERSKAELENSIATLQKRLAELIARFENSDQIIEDAKAKIANYTERIGKLKHCRDIGRMVELQRKINEMGSG